ncbi:unnamed protein product [Laminaria digitata]
MMRMMTTRYLDKLKRYHRPPQPSNIGRCCWLVIVTLLTSLSPSEVPKGLIEVVTFLLLWMLWLSLLLLLLLSLYRKKHPFYTRTFLCITVCDHRICISLG